MKNHRLQRLYFIIQLSQFNHFQYLISHNLQMNNYSLINNGSISFTHSKFVFQQKQQKKHQYSNLSVSNKQNEQNNANQKNSPAAAYLPIKKTNESFYCQEDPILSLYSQAQRSYVNGSPLKAFDSFHESSNMSYSQLRNPLLKIYPPGLENLTMTFGKKVQGKSSIKRQENSSGSSKLTQISQISPFVQYKERSSILGSATLGSCVEPQIPQEESRPLNLDYYQGTNSEKYSSIHKLNKQDKNQHQSLRTQQAQKRIFINTDSHNNNLYQGGVKLEPTKMLLFIQDQTYFMINKQNMIQSNAETIKKIQCLSSRNAQRSNIHMLTTAKQKVIQISDNKEQDSANKIKQQLNKNNKQHLNRIPYLNRSKIIINKRSKKQLNSNREKLQYASSKNKSPSSNQYFLQELRDCNDEKKKITLTQSFAQVYYAAPILPAKIMMNDNEHLNSSYFQKSCRSPTAKLNSKGLKTSILNQYLSQKVIVSQKMLNHSQHDSIQKLNKSFGKTFVPSEKKNVVKPPMKKKSQQKSKY